MLNILRRVYHTVFSEELRFRLYKYRNLREFRELRQCIYASPKGDFSLKPFDENRAIFIHITKTAGTSVALGLFGYLPYHYTARDYRVIYGDKTFNSYFKFAFVRNPWDRLYSAYRYLKSGGWNEADKNWAEANLSQFVDFNQFVCEWLTGDNLKKHLHFKPQYEFLCDDKGSLLVDYLGYFETLEQDYEVVAKRLGLATRLGSHNRNPGDNYLDVYTEESKNIVSKVYARDIALFGYAFDGIVIRKHISQEKRASR